MKILIFGVDSLIGQALSATLTQSGHTIIGTSRRPNSDHIFFDLSEDESTWPAWPQDIDAAFIAVSMTKQKDCADNPALARHINIDQTLKLIQSLRARHIHVVFPSTNLVLACKEPLQSIDTPLQPLGFYGETKAAIERAVRENKGVTIARLPKILDGQSGILKDWRGKFEKGETVNAFENLMIAPVSLRYSIDFLSKILETKPGGLWQISGRDEISYQDLAHAVAKHLNANSNLIHSGLTSGDIPRHPSLDGRLTQEKFGLAPQALEDLLQDCLPV